jgi:hypothetical protein
MPAHEDGSLKRFAMAMIVSFVFILNPRIFEIRYGPFEAIYTIFEHAKTKIAGAAKEAANLSSIVIVIYVSSSSFATKRTLAALSFKHLLMCLERQAIAVLQLCLSISFWIVRPIFPLLRKNLVLAVQVR